MPFLKKPITVLFDTVHKEMCDIDDDEFSEFSSLIKRLGFKIKKNDKSNLTNQVLDDIDVLILGNPIGDYFSNIEIKHILDFVREGGRLLLISEYGSDYLQKTNLNDITSKEFGIVFEKNIVKENNKINENCSSILTVKNFEKNKITNQVREVVIGGTCSFFLNKNAKSLIKTNDTDVWSEIYDDSTEKWIKDDEKQQVIAAYTEYGNGKVITFGDIDIFSNDPNIGINKMDNRKLITNIFNWFNEPVEEYTVINFALNQLGDLQYEVKKMSRKINNIIETITVLEKRMTNIEESSFLKSEHYREFVDNRTIQEE